MMMRETARGYALCDRGFFALLCGDDQQARQSFVIGRPDATTARNTPNLPGAPCAGGDA